MLACRRHLWLVLLLALSLFALSTKAKLAQYGPDLTDTPQITKATKLAEGRQADAIAVEVSAVTPIACPEDPHPGDRPATPHVRAIVPTCWGPAAFRPPPAR